jgi:hypothetical protein
VDKEVADYIQKEIPNYALPWNWTDQPKKISQGNWYWSIYYHVTSPDWIIALHVFFVLIPLVWAAGLFTRITGVLTWIAAMSYVQRASNTVFGLDTMMMITLTYLNIGPAGATLSLDRWLEKRRALRSGERIPEVQPSYTANFALRMTQVHFCIIYLATGTSKLLGSTWWAGTSLNLVLLNASFAPMDQLPYYKLMKFLASHRVLWELVMTSAIAYTLLLEIAFPFLIWVPRCRWLMICGSVLLHTGIGLMMGLVTFSLMMMIMVLSFVPPEVIRRFISQVEEAVTTVRPRKQEPQAKLGKLVLSR